MISPFFIIKTYKLRYLYIFIKIEYYIIDFSKKNILINNSLFIFIFFYEYHELEIKEWKKDILILLNSLDYFRYYFFSLILITVKSHYAVSPFKFYKFILQFIQRLHQHFLQLKPILHRIIKNCLHL